jgi:hypothetical protein
MARLLYLLATLTPIVLSIVSFVLTVVAVTNKDWAHQNTYDGQNVPMSQWTTPLYTLYRSPFWTCSPATSSSTGASSTNITYTITCVRFGPSGGSCLGLVGTGINETDARYGDDRMCQQVKLAGSLAIASSVFVGVGMLTLFVLAVLTILKLLASTTTTSSRHHTYQPRAAVTVGSALSAAVICFLLIGAALLVLAQFYGIEGLIQSAMPNADFAGDGNLPSSVGPWVQGKASLIYASVGWLVALLTAGSVFIVWGVPKLGVGEQGYSAIGTEGNEDSNDIARI